MESLTGLKVGNGDFEAVPAPLGSSGRGGGRPGLEFWFFDPGRHRNSAMGQAVDADGQLKRRKLLAVLQPRQIAATDAKRRCEAFARKAGLDDGCGQHEKIVTIGEYFPSTGIFTDSDYFTLSLFRCIDA